MIFASVNREEITQMIAHWLKVDQEVAAKSYQLGKPRWSTGGVVSDGAVKIVVDQSLLEIKSKDIVPLDKVRNWSFAERAWRDLANSRLPR